MAINADTHPAAYPPNANLPHIPLVVVAGVTFGVFLGHFRINLHQTRTSIPMRDRNIVTKPNFRKSFSKSRILTPKTVICKFWLSKQ